MGRLDEIEMLVAAGRWGAQDVTCALGKIYEELQTSGATRLLSGIDICHAQLASTAVGIFSIYESRLQTRFGWQNPFDEIKALLEKDGQAEEAKRFDNYQLAVNVLKHGVGRSHRTLLTRVGEFPFKVQKIHGELHEEGDVCPPRDLILVDVSFLEGCCDAIEKSWKVIQCACVVSFRPANQVEARENRRSGSGGEFIEIVHDVVD